MELRQYLEIAAAYRRPLILIPLIAAVIGFAASFAVAPRFESIATVQIIPEAVESRALSLRGPGDTSTLAVGMRDPTELIAQGVIEGMATIQVAQAISSGLGLAPAPEPQGWEAAKAWVSNRASDLWALLRYGYVAAADPSTAMERAVHSSLSVQPVRGTYYLRIVATWRDPHSAAAVANEAVRAVSAYTTQMAARAATQDREFLQTQRQQAQQRVDTARAALLEASGTDPTRIVSGESVSAALTALETARAASDQNRLALVEARRRLTLVQQQIATTAPTVVTSDSTSSQNSTTTAASTPAATTKTTETAKTTGANPVYSDLQQKSLDLDREIASGEASQPVLDAAVKTRQDELSKLIVRDQELGGLAREIELAGNDYSQVSAQWYAAMLQEARPDEQLRLISPAIAPAYPVYPIKILWAGIAAVAGLVLALALVYVRYTSDHSFHSAEEAESRLNLPLLARVPVTGPSRATAVRKS